MKDVRKIFVVLGTQKFQLNRLLRELDVMIQNGIIDDEVFAQVGNSDYVPRYYKYTRFLEKEAFEKKVEECDILITHSGVGTIISGLNHGKPVIVYPRLEKYREHVDDHQLQIAKSFSECNYVLLCNEDDNLAKIINESENHEFAKYVSQRQVMLKTIRDFLLEN